MKSREGTRGKLLGPALVAVFLVALVLGAGPGIWLVNSPEQVSLGAGFRLPRIYAWGLLWYLVEATCVLLAYFLVWRSPDEENDG